MTVAGRRAAGGFAAYLGSASLVFGTTCTFLGTAVTLRGNANTGTGSRAHAHTRVHTHRRATTDADVAGMEAGVGTAASDTQHVNMQAFMMRCFV